MRKQRASYSFAFLRLIIEHDDSICGIESKVFVQYAIISKNEKNSTWKALCQALGTGILLQEFPLIRYVLVEICSFQHSAEWNHWERSLWTFPWFFEAFHFFPTYCVEIDNLFLLIIQSFRFFILKSFPVFSIIFQICFNGKSKKFMMV